MKPFVPVVTCLLCITMLAGCATSELTQRQTYAAQERFPRPDRIIVYDIRATPNDIPASASITGNYYRRQSPQTAREVQLGRELGAQVARGIVLEISNMGLTAQRAGYGPAPQIGDILLAGQFILIDKGSQKKRVLIGFGKGSGELRTHMEGYIVTPKGNRLLGSREITSKGGKTPGMLLPLVMRNPAGLILGGAMNIRKESGPETIKGAAKRTVKEIAKELRKVFRRQGWI